VLSDPTEKHPDIDPLERERRFLPSNAELNAFIQVVAAGPLPDANKARQPATTIWTTYLDTDDLRCFRSCDDSLTQRLRVREYEGVSDGGLATCYLELKRTMGSSRSKVRLAVPVAMLARLIEGSGDVDAFFTGRDTIGVALGAIRQELTHGPFAPCVGTTYRRRCLAAGAELRITLDEDLTFFHPVSLGAPRENRAAFAIGPPRVLEVKYAGTLPAWLGEALAALNEVPELSKFRLGMLAVQQAAQLAALPAGTFYRSPFTGPSEVAAETTRHLAAAAP
jgi:hypothetical protein